MNLSKEICKYYLSKILQVEDLFHEPLSTATGGFCYIQANE